VPNDVELLSDAFGGLLYYHPNSDLYSPSINHDLKYVEHYPIDIQRSRSTSVGNTAPRGFAHSTSKDNTKDIQASKVINFPINNIWNGIPFVDIIAATAQARSSSPNNRSRNDNVLLRLPMQTQHIKKPRSRRRIRSPSKLKSPTGMEAFESVDDTDEFLMYAKTLDSISSPIQNQESFYDLKPSTDDDRLSQRLADTDSPNSKFAQQVHFESFHSAAKGIQSTLNPNEVKFPSVLLSNF